MSRKDLNITREALEQGTDTLLVRVARSRWSWLIVSGVLSAAGVVGHYADALNPLQYLGC